MTASREAWDAAAAAFDEEPDHGLRAPATRAAWVNLLEDVLPPAPADILDVGCGTGSLTVVMCDLGHRVVGVDVSPEMLARAEAKIAVAGHTARVHRMDAADPQFDDGSFDVVLSRHLLWVFADPGAVIDRWLRLLRPGGRLVLIEGFWHTGAGLHEADLLTLCQSRGDATISFLTDHPQLWGKPMTDQRYVITVDWPA